MTDQLVGSARLSSAQLCHYSDGGEDDADDVAAAGQLASRALSAHLAARRRRANEDGEAFVPAVEFELLTLAA